LTVKQLAERLNISTNFIYKRTCPGSANPLPFIPVGRGKRFDLEKVRQHLESRQKTPSGVMFSGTDGIARVNGKAFRRMTRKRFQTGSVRLRKDRKLLGGKVSIGWILLLKTGSLCESARA
jgi:excisionase family DNA binding protein